MGQLESLDYDTANKMFFDFNTLSNETNDQITGIQDLIVSEVGIIFSLLIRPG